MDVRLQGEKAERALPPFPRTSGGQVMAPELKIPGKIITFYSYKGGTGRTMALANVACLLAKRHKERTSKGVLMIDWDLEAPGLHRFFQHNFNKRFASISDQDKALDKEPGLTILTLSALS
jgi:cellulose biosynthesis protein BcsQ